jgi:hypothetical protein
MIIERKNKNYINENFSNIDFFGLKKIESMTIDQIFESLDYKPKLTDISDDFNIPDGADGSKMYQSETGEHYMTIDRDGSTEIHHITKDGISGKLLTGDDVKKGPNSRFASGMFHLGNELLTQGKTVHISAPKQMAEKYHKIAKRISKTNMVGNVSDLTYHKVDMDADKNLVDFHHFYITPKQNNITEAVKFMNKMLK